MTAPQTTTPWTLPQVASHLRERLDQYAKGFDPTATTRVQVVQGIRGESLLFDGFAIVPMDGHYTVSRTHPVRTETAIDLARQDVGDFIFPQEAVAGLLVEWFAETLQNHDERDYPELAEADDDAE